MSKIAILAYGSLIRNPRNLKLKEDWQYGGPELPIEFSKINRDGRLVLSLSPGHTPQATFYATSSFHEPGKAMANLARREGCSIYYIHAFEPVNILQENWLKERGYDHALYCALPSNFEEVRGEKLYGCSAARYLNTLNADAFDEAWEYIENAPEEIHSEVRDFLLKNYGTFLNKTCFQHEP